MIVPAEILRGARVAARMSRAALAKDSRLASWTIGKVERGGRVDTSTLAGLAAALERAGIVFLGSADGSSGPGMRLTFQGPEASALVVRAAAAARGFGSADLATKAGVGERTVVRLLEAGVGERPTLEKFMTALEREGVVFLAPGEGHGPGFRLPLSLIGRKDLRF